MTSTEDLDIELPGIKTIETTAINYIQNGTTLTDLLTSSLSGDSSELSSATSAFTAFQTNFLYFFPLFY